MARPSGDRDLRGRQDEREEIGDHGCGSSSGRDPENDRGGAPFLDLDHSSAAARKHRLPKDTRTAYKA